MREGVTPKRSSLKGLDWPLHREKKKKRGFCGLGLESKVSAMDVGLKQLKVTTCGVDGGWERVLVSGSQRDKRVGERTGSIFIQFDSEGVLSVRKPRVSRKEDFWEGN